MSRQLQVGCVCEDQFRTEQQQQKALSQLRTTLTSWWLRSTLFSCSLGSPPLRLSESPELPPRLRSCSPCLPLQGSQMEQVGHQSSASMGKRIPSNRGRGAASGELGHGHLSLKVWGRGQLPASHSSLRSIFFVERWSHEPCSMLQLAGIRRA